MKKDTQAVDPKIIWAIVGTGILAFTGILTETSMNVTFPDLMKQFGCAVANHSLSAHGVIGHDNVSVLESKIQSPYDFYDCHYCVFDWGYCGNLVTLICLVTGWTHYSGDWDWRDYAIGV